MYNYIEDGVLEDTVFSNSEVNALLYLLFKRELNVEVKIDKDVLILDIKDNLNKLVKPKLPVNIKNNNILGWYCELTDLCLIPIQNRKYLLKKEVPYNKQIRPLTTKF